MGKECRSKLVYSIGSFLCVLCVLSRLKIGAEGRGGLAAKERKDRIDGAKSMELTRLPSSGRVLWQMPSPGPHLWLPLCSMCSFAAKTRPPPQLAASFLLYVFFRGKNRGNLAAKERKDRIDGGEKQGAWSVEFGARSLLHARGSLLYLNVLYVFFRG
jgi:hypothetical protein